jgi:hypothetical protein
MEIHPRKALRRVHKADHRPATGYTPVLAGVLAVAVVAGVILVILSRREEPGAVDTPPPQRQVEIRRSIEPGASALTASGAGPSGRQGAGQPALASRVLRVTPRRVVKPERPALDPDDEEVIENRPGERFPRGVGAKEYIKALREMGETEGIAAFPPPGTNPPKAGVIVPDEYELPEGYERYYQQTDDGKPLQPILLFSPDYEFFDEEGNRIAIPEDRVVPPHLVPPGLPVQILDPERPPDSDELIGQRP